MMAEVNCCDSFGEHGFERLSDTAIFCPRCGEMRQLGEPVLVPYAQSGFPVGPTYIMTTTPRIDTSLAHARTKSGF